LVLFRGLEGEAIFGGQARELSFSLRTNKAVM